MAAWALSVVLLCGGVDADLERALAKSNVRQSGLGLAVGRAGEPPLLVVAPDAPRIPASNQKILTAAAALWKYGADARFETTIAKGPRGELVVVGNGDPNFSGRFFDGDANRVLRNFARDVAAKGLVRVTDLVLDASRFDGETVHPDWPADQLGRWYCAPVAALVYNDSCWDVTVLPGEAPGDPARVRIEPALTQPALTLDCVTVGKSGDHVVHIGRARERGVEVRGRILATSAGVSGHVAVRDPVAFFGRAFRSALEREGVTVTGEIRRGAVADATPVLVYRSPLRRALGVMLRDSQNLYAECIFKSLGSGSFAGGAAAMAATLEERGVPVDGLAVHDGSGLARTNRVTAATLYAVLQKLRDDEAFTEALATGGTGTLRRRYRGLGDRVRAKTGTIAGVTSLSGYVAGADGGRYVFVILANGRSVRHGRRLQDLIVRTLAEAP